MKVSKYGYYLPEAGDESSTEWQPSIRENWEKISYHNHDGINSPQIATGDLLKQKTYITSDMWNLAPNGIEYEVIIPLPEGYKFNNTFIYTTIITSGHVGEGTRAYLEITKRSATEVRIVSYTNTIDVELTFV